MRKISSKNNRGKSGNRRRKWGGLKDVIIRYRINTMAFHIDIEEANAANIQGTIYCRILYK